MLTGLLIRQHVYGDIRPYICLQDTCHLIDNSFSRRKDWVTHMVHEHWRAWICPFGCARCLPTSSHLSNHMSQDHGSAIPISELKLQTKANMELAQGSCPLCLEYQITSSRQYGSHVGNHLEQLALFVLPGADQADEESDKEADEEDNQEADEEAYEEADEEAGSIQAEVARRPQLREDDDPWDFGWLKRKEKATSTSSFGALDEHEDDNPWGTNWLKPEKKETSTFSFGALDEDDGSKDARSFDFLGGSKPSDTKGIGVFTWGAPKAKTGDGDFWGSLGNMKDNQPQEPEKPAEEADDDIWGWSSTEKDVSLFRFTMLQCTLCRILL